MSKHTPWEIEWGNPIAIGDGVAFVPQSLDGTHTATAYLISQAPAMLEALERLIEAGGNLRTDLRTVQGMRDMSNLLEATDAARAAIAAAKGEA